MKNFLDIEEIPWLVDIKYSLIDAALQDLSEFVLKLPQEQKTKYNNILKTDFIKMYAVPIYFDQQVFCPCSGNNDELFNFTADGPEQNYEGGNGVKAKEIDKLLGPLFPSQDDTLFCKTISLIPEQIRTGWIFFYKNGALVEEKDGHGHTTIMIHFLLEDIEEGEFVVHVNNETRKLSKKGEYFIFNGILPHGAQFLGKNAKFLTFAANCSDLPAV
jgi:hypothetical protein